MSTVHIKTVRGVTLVELMITIAIIAVIAAIAVPAYNGYIREGHFTAMRTNLSSLRTPIEDFRLDNGSYGGTTTLTGLTAIDGRFGWDPGADLGAYSYTVAVVSTNNYHVWATHPAGVWARCENRFGRCCDSSTPGASSASSACP